ncbi:MAG TPA: hypothetical protein PLO78_05195 [Candidatus Omnitrophota bacterium]|nr:hypothetical protein [Candidatus Omnitrophota bacterium]
MKRFPPDRLRLPEAVDRYQKHGFTWASLRRAIERKRLEGFQIGSTWYTTDQAVKKYLKSRDMDKIPKRYRKKS